MDGHAILCKYNLGPEQGCRVSAAQGWRGILSDRGVEAGAATYAELLQARTRRRISPVERLLAHKWLRRSGQGAII